jgi:hypothetical protein
MKLWAEFSTIDKWTTGAAIVAFALWVALMLAGVIV